MPAELTALAGLERTLLRNSATMMGSKIISALLSLLIVPLIVSRVGIEGYGIWEALLAAAMVAATFQNAITGTVLWKAASDFGSGEHERVRETVRLGTALIGVELMFVQLPVWIFRHRLVAALSVPAAQHDLAAVLLPATTLVVILVGVSEVLGNVVSGCQQAGAFAVSQTIAQLVNYLVVMGCLALGLGLPSMVLGMGIGALVTIAMLMRVLRTIVGRVSLLPRAPRRTDLRVIWPYLRSMAWGSVAITVRGHLTKVVTASVASPLWTGYYGIASRLASTILLMLSFFSGPSVSAFGALAATDAAEDVRRLYLRMLRFISVFAGAVTVLVASAYDHIVFLWLGTYLPDVTPILVVLVATNTLVTILTGIGSSLCKGTGRPGVETRYVLVGLAINVLLLPLGVVARGAMGAVIASALSYVISAAYFVVVLDREYRLPRASYQVMMATSVAITVSVVVARTMNAWLPAASTRADALLVLGILGSAAVGIFLVAARAMGVFRWSSLSTVVARS